MTTYRKQAEEAIQQYRAGSRSAFGSAGGAFGMTGAGNTYGGGGFRQTGFGGGPAGGMMMGGGATMPAGSSQNMYGR